MVADIRLREDEAVGRKGFRNACLEDLTLPLVHLDKVHHPVHVPGSAHEETVPHLSVERRFLQRFLLHKSLSAYHALKGLESPGRKAGFRSGCSQCFAYPFMLFPKGRPTGQTPGTQAVGKQHSRHTRHLVHALRNGQAGGHGLVTPQRLVQCPPFGHGIEQLQAITTALQAGGEEFQVFPLLGCHVIDMLHVTVEGSSPAKIAEHQCQSRHAHQYKAVHPLAAGQVPAAERQIFSRTPHRPARTQENG